MLNPLGRWRRAKQNFFLKFTPIESAIIVRSTNIIERSERMRNRNLPFYWIVFLFIAAVVMLSESYYLYKDIQAAAWPTATGHLRNTHMPTPTPSSIPKWDGVMVQPLTSIKLTYSYDVDGMKYLSDNISFGLTFNVDIDRINIGDTQPTQVKVYFNPSDPQEAVLIPGPKAINVFLIAVSSLSLCWILRRVKQ